MLSRLCTIRFPASIARDREGLDFDGEPIAWSEVRGVGILTWISMASVDADYVVIQTVSGSHYWIGVCGRSDLAGWNARNWTDETVARVEAWWAEALAGLEDPPASISLGRPAMLGVVRWPPQERGQPMYEERPRRLLGFIPWGEDLAPLLT
ncbi:MAG: hypothetical protein KDC98_08345 [Planctomycetes bacterium]|nr:hypothetical protein [Planctomycetota bacterium]